MIYLKLLIKNIIDNRTKLILLLLSVTLSTALFIISLMTTDSMESIAIENITNMYGDTQVIVTMNDTKIPFMADDIKIKGLDQRMPLLILDGVLNEIDGKHEAEIDVNLIGVNEKDIDHLVVTNLISRSDISNFKGNKAIISYVCSQKNNIKIGDRIKVEISGQTKKLEVVAIAENKGFFGSELNNITLLVPKEFAEKTIDLNKQCNAIYASLND